MNLEENMAGSEEAQVIACHTVDGFNEQIQKGNDSKKLVTFIFFSVLFLFLDLFT